MRHHHSPGIRGQLMWFLCCICLFLLALVWFLSTQLLEPLYTKHIEKQLTTQAENITADLDKALAEDETLSSWSFGRLSVNTSFFDRLATQLYASGSLNSFCVDISDSTMRTIYKIENQSYCNLHETLLSDSANNDMIVSTAVAMRKKCRTTGGFVQTLNPPRLSGSAQLLVGRNTAGGEYTVLVTTSLVHVAEAGKILSTVLPMAAAVIFAFAMTAGWLFSEWFTKPLRQLSSAARQMAMGNYAVQVDTRRSDELGDLAQDFNHMANEVQRSSQMQRDLLANVSHDLRTPLTALLGYLEILQGDPRPASESPYLGKCRQRALQIRGMLNDLFEYFFVSTSDKTQADFPPCTVEQAFGKLLAEFADLLRQDDFAVNTPPLPSGTVRVNAGLLQRLFDNLLSNLRRYADRTQPVKITLLARDKELALIVSNTARPDAKPGTGLGLQNCAQMLRLHGGRFEHSLSDGVFTAAAYFPME